MATYADAVKEYGKLNDKQRDELGKLVEAMTGNFTEYLLYTTSLPAEDVRAINRVCSLLQEIGKAAAHA